MGTQKEYLVQAMQNDTIFMDADFHTEAEAVKAAQDWKNLYPEAIVARYKLVEEL